MKEVKALLIAWILTSLVGFFSFNFGNLEEIFLDVKKLITLFSLTAIMCAMYIGFVCLPIFFFLLQLTRVSRTMFLVAGLISSMPITILGGYANDSTWVVGSVLAGIVGGCVFALLLPDENN